MLRSCYLACFRWDVYCIVDMNIVRTSVRNIITVVALDSYMLVGAVGFWNTVDQFFLHGTHPWVIKKGKPPSPSPCKVVWTQQKHYPSTTNNDVQTPAVIAQGTCDHWKNSFEVAITRPLMVTATGFSLLSTPRAPPLS